MSNQSNADALHSQVVLLRMQGKTTEELLAIWQENDRTQWSKEDFDAVQTVLAQRIGKLPEQNHPETSTKKAASSEPNPPMVDNLSRKYPYLTAYVGFVALFLLLSLVSNFIPIVGLILQVVGGFYIFKFVIEKNVLPHVEKK
jgi:hypothetical protein